MSGFSLGEVAFLFFVWGGFLEFSVRFMVLLGKTNEAMRKFRQQEKLPAFGPDFE